MGCNKGFERSNDGLYHQLLKSHVILGGVFKYFLFSPLPGEMIQFG